MSLVSFISSRQPLIYKISSLCLTSLNRFSSIVDWLGLIETLKSVDKLFIILIIIN